MTNKIVSVSAFTEALKTQFPNLDLTEVKTSQMERVWTGTLGMWLSNADLSSLRVKRGTYNFMMAPAQASFTQTAPPSDQPVVAPASSSGNVAPSMVPAVDPNFVGFGIYKNIVQVIKSKIFYPVYIQGSSGNGKTHSVEQACASLGREMVRVNITIETDEDDLIGHYVLINGETIWQDGPITLAAKRGAVALLDEADLGSAKLMALQPVLEGKPFFIKKTNEWVNPAPGFTIVATANTKGKGSDDGRYIGTNVMNEAFLDRFAVTMVQAYPKYSVEVKIINKVLVGLGLDDTKFAEELVTWAGITRATFEEGAIDEMIATRRLVHAAKAYSIFKDKTVAIEMTLNRFDDLTRMAFQDLWDKVSSGETADSIQPPDMTPTEYQDEPDLTL